MENKTRLIIVGGFLGAGKTTLLFETTKKLMKKDKKVGLITNDQASELVDTALLIQTQVDVEEVSGSCFCCNFSAFLDSLQKVSAESQTDIVIAEPVGSCTDLSATIIQPLKEILRDKLLISPLTVLADPFKLKDILDGGTADLHPSSAYIYQKQLEESDIILISKTDLLSEDELSELKDRVKLKYPHADVLSLSSKSGEGIEDWLAFISTNTKSGQKILDIDYDVYAEGEAVLGWLNASLNLDGKQVDWDEMLQALMNKLNQILEASKIGIGHLKILIENEDKSIIANLTGNSETLTFRGEAGISNHSKITINARVSLKPDDLNDLILNTLREITMARSIRMNINAWESLSPGYPKPTHRYNKTVE